MSLCPAFFTGSVTGCTSSPTDNAYPSSARENVGVLRSKLVSLGADVDSPSNVSSSGNVFFQGDRLQMSGVYTPSMKAVFPISAVAPVVTKVVKGLTVGDRTDQKLISEPVSLNVFPFPVYRFKVKASVSVSDTSNPFPACIGLIDVLPKAIFGGKSFNPSHFQRVAVGLPSIPVGITKTSGNRRFSTILNRAESSRRRMFFSPSIVMSAAHSPSDQLVFTVYNRASSHSCSSPWGVAADTKKYSTPSEQEG